ncbi:hypothetical protein RCH12_002965 [Cryobacterium sp. MP_3.1]|nr:hypothetical protein [Cryobacterium sp. MP_3.1]
MAPNANIRWLPLALLAKPLGGPQSQYQWPPEALILNVSALPLLIRQVGLERGR